MRFRFADFEADGDRFELRRSGEPVAIEPKPLRLLLFLLERHPSAPSKDEILAAIWPDAVVSDAALSRAVRAVRRALGESASGGDVLRTVRGRGFRIGVDVERSDAAAPAPARAERSAPQPAAAVPCHGRTRELARIAAALDAALAGAGGACVISGPGGIGKSRLARESGLRAERNGARVLWASAHEAEPDAAFLPWVRLLRDLEPARLAAPFDLDSLARILPELGDGARAAPTLDEGEERVRLFDAVTRTIASAARESPLVLVFDDLQWADGPSLSLLEFAARELDRAPVALLCTCRDAAVQVGALGRALATLARSGDAAEVVEVAGLDAEAIGALAREALGDERAAEVAPLVAQRSGGNPLFAQELLRILAAEPERPAERALAGVPAGIRAVLQRRADGLPEACREALAVACVLGAEPSLELIARCRGVDVSQGLSDLDPAFEAGLVEAHEQEPGRLRFAHELLRETLYGELGLRERARWHLRAADAIEALYARRLEPHLAALAAHAHAAAALGGAQRAARYGLRAARHAAEGLAFEDAARLAERALEGLDHPGAEDPELRCALLDLYSEALFRIGEREASGDALWELVECARSAGEHEAFARAAAALGIRQLYTADSHEAVRGVLEEALERLPADDSALRAELLAALSRQLVWSDTPERQPELSRAAVEMARRVGDVRTLLEVLGTHGSRLELFGDDAERRTIHDELLSLARRHRSRLYEADARLLRMQHAIARAEPETAEAEHAALDELAEALRHPHYRAFVAWGRAIRALWRGELEAAETLIARGHAQGQLSDPALAANAAAGQLAALRRLQGRVSELETPIRQAISRQPHIASFRCMLALLCAESAREDEARALFEPLVDDPESGPRETDPNYLLDASLLAEVCALLGDERRAPRVAARLEGAGVAYIYVPNVVTAGAPAYFVGLLRHVGGDFEGALSALDEALAIEQRMAARPRIASVRLAQGRSQAALGRGSEAAEAWKEAAALAEQLGLPAIGSAARAGLAAS